MATKKVVKKKVVVKKAAVKKGVNPFAKKGMQELPNAVETPATIAAEKAAGKKGVVAKKKGSVPPGLAAYLAKKKAGK
jgi:hypothetical protein